ncbi:MAG: LysR family transcriptional regulator, partial [Gammaproteobacteria bacterium]|nr:LysR family transcriptional regulator [Gammaproteobacteria bacterium]
MDNLDIEGKSAAISVRQLKLFETTARLASVRRAADECSLSQPAVTQALAKLEDQVGAKLLERRSSGSYLNKCGEIFYPRAVRFFTQLEEAICELAVPGGPATVPIIAKRFSRAHLRCLIAVVDSGSFSQAASLLQINQSSLQRIARTIEKNLGKTIFCGAATGKIVTPAGEQFGRKLKLALREIDWGVQEIDAALGNSTATIIVGAMPSGGSVLLASVLDEFVSAHPATDVKIVTENAPELLKSLASGGVDLAIGLAQATMDSEFNFESLAKTPYRVVARRGHPLA